MSSILKIVDVLNTYNPALVVIRSKGYCIFLIPNSNEDSFGDYWAIKDSRDFIAHDPLRLLALISIWEYKGDSWNEYQSGRRKFRIFDKTNIHNTAIEFLLNNEFKIYKNYDEHFYESSASYEAGADYLAKKGGREFLGGDPLRLLGVISMWENLGDNWQPRYNDYEDIEDEVSSIAYPDDDSYSDFSDNEFEKIILYLTPYFDAIDYTKRPNRKELYVFFKSCLEIETE